VNSGEEPIMMTMDMVRMGLPMVQDMIPTALPMILTADTEIIIFMNLPEL
jgi:hypothetical protein